MDCLLGSTVRISCTDKLCKVIEIPSKQIIHAKHLSPRDKNDKGYWLVNTKRVKVIEESVSGII